VFDTLNSDTLAALFLILVVFQFKRIGTFLNLSKIRLRSSDWSPVPREESVMPPWGACLPYVYSLSPDTS
jgi:hypothetical protein